MKMVDLKLDKKDKKGTAQPEIVENDYPYGARLNLDSPTLDKFEGLDKLKDGDKVRVDGVATVVSVSHNESNGEVNRSISLQIEELALEQEGRDSEKLSDRLDKYKKED